MNIILDLDEVTHLEESQLVLSTANSHFEKDRIAISFSGAEDVVIIDMAYRLDLEFKIFTLDTGRLHSETHRFLETVCNHYKTQIELLLPEPADVAHLVSNKGLFSFYKDGHAECCEIRKIAPLRKKLSNLDAWITGQRQDQSVTRSNVPLEQQDHVFSTDTSTLTKFNPLINWTSREVWSYIRNYNVPYNPLHDRGFVSIGCEPCTRAIGPHEDERTGRWWWEEAANKECGLLPPPANSHFEKDRIAISFSGAEDVVIIDMAYRLDLEFKIFTLDTGRLHSETHRFLETVCNHYKTQIELLLPEPADVAHLVSNKGLFSFYKDGHAECCEIRKIAPLRKKLSNLDAWITGQRQDQSVTRSNVPLEQQDHVFSTDTSTLTKFNPLINWTSREVWSYIRNYNVPYNPLHDRGFVSIGCEPCTRAIGPHEDERTGRWWWEQAANKECGLHGSNIVKLIG